MQLYKLGQNIKAKRMEIKMTQEQLSERCNISTVFLSQIENARKYPSLETLCKISEELGTTIETLFHDKCSDKEKGRIEALLVGKTENERDFLLDIMDYIS